MLTIMVVLANLSLCYAQDESPKENVDTITSQRVSDNTDSFEQNRKKWVIEIGYEAGDIRIPRTTGAYGIAMTVLPWKLAPRFYLGCHVTFAGLNFGLVDWGKATYVMKVGPTWGYYFSEKIFMAMPVNVVCELKMSREAPAALWGLQMSPAFYFGKKCGVYIGPQVKIPFSGIDVATLGFRAGMYF